MWSYSLAAAVFCTLLVTTAVAVGRLSPSTVGSVRMTGPQVKRWGGYTMLAVALWFATLALLPAGVLPS